MISHLYEAKRRHWTVPKRWRILDTMVQKMLLVTERDGGEAVLCDHSDEDESSSDGDVEIIDRAPLAFLNVESSDEEDP